MNLKEAFRYQNKLQQLMNEGANILSRDKNVTKIENTALLHKVNPDAKDEVTWELPETEYAQQITDIALLLMFLLEERQRLSAAIRKAKHEMDLDFDGEVSLNGKRQELAGIFRHMSEIRASEHIYSGLGTGYKFNAEGNQVSYRCDLKKVTSINFDRNKVRAFTTALCKQADQISAQLDSRLINTTVSYEPPFDANDTFQQVLQWHMEQNS